jgi:hypothetical protein
MVKLMIGIGHNSCVVFKTEHIVSNTDASPSLEYTLEDSVLSIVHAATVLELIAILSMSNEYLKRYYSFLTFYIFMCTCLCM